MATTLRARPAALNLTPSAHQRIADLMAKAAQGGGCGVCHECHTVLAGSHADVHRVVPEGLSIGVAEVRQIVRTAGRAPSQGRWQIVVVEDADRMTEQAGNTVLKMLEEPPPRTVFLLCAPSLHPDCACPSGSGRSRSPGPSCSACWRSPRC